MDHSLEDRVAVVTGAARGLGRAIALELACRGAFVVVNDKDDPHADKRLPPTLEFLKAWGGRGRFYRADVTQADQVREMFQTVLREQKRVDVLVNNAGVSCPEFFTLMRPLNWHKALDVHMHAVFHCTKAVIRPMCAAKRGVILNIGTGGCFVPLPGQVNYTTSKSALLGFSRSLAREVASHGVRVVHVAAGFFRTDITEGLDPAVYEETCRVTPLGRWGCPEELASLVGFLASDDAAYLTGHTVIIDGGRNAVEPEYGSLPSWGDDHGTDTAGKGRRDPRPGRAGSAGGPPAASPIPVPRPSGGV